MTTTARKTTREPERTLDDAFAEYGAPDGYANAENAERAARALGEPNGKHYRSVMRDVLDVHVQQGHAFTQRERVFMLAVLRTRGVAARRAIGDAFKRGDALPPTPTA